MGGCEKRWALRSLNPNDSFFSVLTLDEDGSAILFVQIQALPP